MSQANVMRLQPLFARVIIEREQLKTSLIIPADAARRNAPSRGRIVAVGDRAEPEIKALVGSMVLFGQHAGAWFNAEGTVSADGAYFVCNEEDLIAVVSDGTSVRKAA